MKVKSTFIKLYFDLGAEAWAGLREPTRDSEVPVISNKGSEG